MVAHIYAGGKHKGAAQDETPGIVEIFRDEVCTGWI